MAFIWFQWARPYRFALCNLLQSSALLSLLLTYTTALVFFDDGKTIDESLSGWLGTLLVALGSSSFVVVIVGSAHSIYREGRRVHSRRLFYKDGGRPVTPRPLTGRHPSQHEGSVEFRTAGTTLQWHLFLSHAWQSGQDQMRLVKSRLSEVRAAVPRDEIEATRLHVYTHIIHQRRDHKCS